ncbi:MAG: toxic anion resistance protein, partial [Alphaproteobacteria bacterium]|nr:toxic anion resistance protein [Alphaproteobacteria bacterium]
MADTTRDRAQATLADVEKMTAVVLPEPPAEMVTLDTADKSTSEAITRRMNEIDLTDTNSIVTFGTAAQAGLQQISQDMLSGVRNKDVGPAGESLRSIVSTIRGFSVAELDPNRKQSWFDKLLGRATPLSKFVAKYEDVQTQIDKITDDLLGHETMLMKDIESLDRL